MGMRLLDFSPKAPPGSPLCPLSHPEKGVWTFVVTLSCGLLGSPQLFWVTPCEKQERGVCVVAQGGREGGKESGAMGSLSSCMGGTPLCVSVPSGWPGAVCPADAHPHPDHRVCSQPDDGLQPTLQFEPQAVSTHSCKTYPHGEGVALEGCGGAGILPPFFLAFFSFFALSPDPIAPAASELFVVLRQV